MPFVIKSFNLPCLIKIYINTLYKWQELLMYMSKTTKMRGFLLLAKLILKIRIT